MEMGNCEEKPVSRLDFRNVETFVASYNVYSPAEARLKKKIPKHLTDEGSSW